MSTFMLYKRKMRQTDFILILKYVFSYFKVKEIVLNDDQIVQTVKCLPINREATKFDFANSVYDCLLYTSPSPRDGLLSRMPSSA